MRGSSHRSVDPVGQDLDLSVIICTYNRAKLLDRALASIARATPPEGCRWEVLLVDNGSTDATQDVTRCWKGPLPLRVVLEPETGLSAARNRAMAEARGRMLLFTDDDVDVAPDWLQAMMDARRRWPSAAYLAGTILPAFELPPPTWLNEACQRLLSGVLVRFSLPRSAGPLTGREPRPMGANLAFDARALRDVGGFRTDLGRKGQGLIGGEEVAVLDALDRRNAGGIYVPQAVVRHHTPAKRLTHWFLLRYFIAVGTAAVRMGSLEDRGRLGPPAWMLRKTVTSALAYARTSLTGPADEWIRRMKVFGYYLGACRELIAERVRTQSGVGTRQIKTPLQAT